MIDGQLSRFAYIDNELCSYVVILHLEKIINHHIWITYLSGTVLKPLINNIVSKIIDDCRKFFLTLKKSFEKIKKRLCKLPSRQAFQSIKDKGVALNFLSTSLNRKKVFIIKNK